LHAVMSGVESALREARGGIQSAHRSTGRVSVY
jgi:hypothetical protein